MGIASINEIENLKINESQKKVSVLLMKTITTTYLKLILFVILCLLSWVCEAQTKSNEIKTINGKKFYIHKVEKGQSLYAIAKTYNMDINSILSENDDAIDGLNNGQELKIPFESSLQKQSSAIDTNKYLYHLIKKGETVYAITKKYNIDEKKLLSYNPSLTSNLKEGEFIIVGEKKRTAYALTKDKLQKRDTLFYTVNAGETIYSLTKKFNITQEEFLKWNPTVKGTVQLGKIVKVPSTGLSHTVETLASNKNADSLLYSKPKKTSYTVGLFLPFKLAENESINVDELARSKSGFPGTQALALDFYAGFKKAVDSLRAKDFDIALNIYDVQERDSLKIEIICQSNEFKSLDLIVGPLYPGGFKVVSAYAKTLGIPAISPLTQQSKILYNNPLTSKINPSQFTIIESLADFCIDSLMAANIILVNTTLKDEAYTKAFKERYNEEILKHGRALKDSLTIVKGIAGIKIAFVPGKKNTVIMLTHNPVYLQDVITQLYVYSDKKDIVLMGFNSVANIDNLDQDYLNGLNFHYASAVGITEKDSIVQRFTKEYQNIYTVDPSDNYFQGFDIAMYYLQNLKLQGPNLFLNLDKTPGQGISTGFKFYRPDAETGFENRAVFIFKYSNYKVQKLGWK